MHSSVRHCSSAQYMCMCAVISTVVEKWSVACFLPFDVQADGPGHTLRARHIPWHAHALQTLSIAVQLPTEYFCQVLGRWRKYSACLYRDKRDTLDQAEENMLRAHQVP
jgi:hypothetical protein